MKSYKFYFLKCTNFFLHKICVKIFFVNEILGSFLKNFANIVGHIYHILSTEVYNSFLQIVSIGIVVPLLYLFRIKLKCFSGCPIRNTLSLHLIK